MSNKNNLTTESHDSCTTDNDADEHDSSTKFNTLLIGHLESITGAVEVIEEGDATIEMSEDVLQAIDQVIKEDVVMVQKQLCSSSQEEEEVMTTIDITKIFYDGFFNCDKCDRKIKRKDNFKRHYQQVHGIIYQDNQVKNNCKNVCIFPGCEEVFYHKSKMVEHLQGKHKIKVESETKKFNNVEEFLAWKESEETSNFVWFPKKDERKISSGVMYTSYVCQCNGLKQSTPLKNTSTKRKTVKKNLICPARMLAKTDMVTKEVTVKYIKSHNHKISCDDMQNKPIPKEVKEEITKKLLENKSVDDVFSELHQEALDETASNTSIQKVFIQKHKIKYLQQKLNLPKDYSKNKVPIEDRLKALTSDDFNPILLYKPSDDVIENWSSDRDNSAEDTSTFIFAIQTKEQNTLFEMYAKHIVFLELTNPTPHLPFYILTIKVLDEVMQPYNVAHLISNICDDDIAQLFFNEVKVRYEGKELQIHLVMTTLNTYGVEPFRNVFGKNIQFIYSKWHFHKLLFSKLLTDSPVEEELRHQVYFTLVALIEQRDKEQFKVIASDFFHSYKTKCLNIVTFMADLYLRHPEKWALCYRDSNFHYCDHYMHINTTFQRLKALLGSMKEACSVDTLLHTLLNIDQSTYLKQKCKQRLAEISPSSHEISLTISDEDLNKISDTQWIVLLDGATYEVNWNSDGCLEEFCSTRCLELLCFGLCQHMYMCNCRNDTLDICPHVHKVHSFEMGVSQCQKTMENEQHSFKHKKFRLYGQYSTVKPANKEMIERIEQNLVILQQYVHSNPSQEILEEIDENLEDLSKCCHTAITKRRKVV